MKPGIFASKHGAPTDLRWICVAKKAGVPVGMVSAVAWALFDYASQQTERGSILNFDFETYADYSGWDEADVVAILGAMKEKGIIADGMIAEWGKHQKTDAGAPARGRASRERARQRQSCALPVDDCASPAEPISALISEPGPEKPALEPVCQPQVDKAEPMSPRVILAPAPYSSYSPSSSATISHEAIALADEIAVIAGHDLRFVPPSWCGAALRVQMWLDRGWNPLLIVESVRAQLARRVATGPPASVQFFEGAIRDRHVAFSRPVPNVTQFPMRKSRYGPTKNPLMAAADKLISELEQREREGGKVSALMLPARGCE